MQYENCKLRAKRCLDEYKTDAVTIEGLVKDRRLLERKLGKEECKRRLDEIIKFNESLKVEAAEAIRKSAEVRSVIDRIPGIEGDVIRARHVEGLVWDDIADKLYYSYGGVFKAYHRGLKIVQDVLDAAAQEGKAD